MIVTAITIGTLASAYLLLALALMVRLGLSVRQAMLYLPLRLAFSIDDRAIVTARKEDAPLIYLVVHRSRLDPALMLSLLPDDTLHILDGASAGSAWLEPWRELARTITFKAEHVFVSRRLVRVLKRKGRIAVYVPEDVEPDVRSFRLYRAIARIAEQADARIMPIFVDGAERLPRVLAPGSPARHSLRTRLTIGVVPGRTVADLIKASISSSTTRSNALFDRVGELRSQTKATGRSLFQGVVDAASRFGPAREAVEDTISGTLSYRRMLIAARIFAARFARATAPGETVGVLLPNGNGLVITLLALWSAGRAACPINHTAGAASMTSAARTVPLRLILSSRLFVKKAGLEAIVSAAEAGGARFIWIEDWREGITGFERVAASLLWRIPVGRQVADAPAAILFSSGSEGLPKAIVLSHGNLFSNAMQVEARLAIGPSDRLLAVLPAFHALGLTGSVTLPLLTGVRTYHYPTPLHFRQIPEIAAKTRPTVLFATDTFLAAYAKAAKDDDFASLRLVVAGAEPLRPGTLKLWSERFGVVPLEGYGLTEASPVLALNTATHNRAGTVGRPLPGLRGRLEPVEGVAPGGRLVVSGPNVMLGYILPDNPGALLAPADGWHDSGDIVSVDREGFLTVLGRVKRFAKIAGEMVSLAAVESMAERVWPEGRHAAAALPDAKRGERIVLLTTTPEAELSAFRQAARAAGLADIAMPDAIVLVDEIPTLGTGKTDFPAVRRLAENPPAAAVA
jgi:acyl-[acyl-carrier-protein]-phospholipid O-acyltransferase/long-chain-fatty-acid--[acyl-carrier-protein] ligase